MGQNYRSSFSFFHDQWQTNTHKSHVGWQTFESGFLEFVHLPKSINVAFFLKTQSCPCSLLRQPASLEGFWHINIFPFNTALMFSTFYENWSEHTQIPNTKQLKKQRFSDNFLLWTGDTTDTRERKNGRRNLSWSEVSPHRPMAQLIPSYALNLQMSERTSLRTPLRPACSICGTAAVWLWLLWPMKGQQGAASSLWASCHDTWSFQISVTRRVAVIWF